MNLVLTGTLSVTLSPTGLITIAMTEKNHDPAYLHSSDVPRLITALELAQRQAEYDLEARLDNALVQGDAHAL